MHRNEAQEWLEPLPTDGGAARAVGADADIPGLPYVRLTQRGRPPRERRSLWTLLALVLLGHVLLAWLAYLVLRPSPYRHDEGGAFMVTLVEPSPESPPPPPLLAPPPLPGQPPLVHREAPAPGAITATLEGVKPPRLELYDSNGQIRLSGEAAKPSAPAPAYSAPTLQGSQIYNGKSPVPYKPTQFNKDWAPDHETLGAKTIGRAYDKAVEKTTAVKTVRLPGGLKVKCGISPLLLMAGCQSSPPPSAPPDELENDIRLSMPPPATLTGKKVPLPSSASSVSPPASGKP